MRTVTYKSLLEGTLKMAGEFSASVQADDRLKLGEFLAQALSACHEYWRWPELVRIEERFCRDFYASAATYAAGAEVWFAATRKYYRALRATTGNAPATLTGGSYVTNAAFWWEMSATVEASDWATGTNYLVGVFARNPTDGRFYACHTAHTALAGFDASKFGEIGAFRPYVAYEQTGKTAIEAVIECYDRDPRSDTAALKVPFRLDEEGVRFAPDQASPIWIEYRRREPDFAWTGEWTAGSYAAGAVVYHGSSGEVYKSSAAATAAEVPGVAAVWVRQEVPYIFRHAAKFKALAGWLQAEEFTDKALVFDNENPGARGRFQEAIEEQVWQYTKLQGQTGRVQRSRSF